MGLVDVTPIDNSLKTSDGSIVLSYIYKGECPDCKSNLETLEQDLTIDNKDHHFALAYCLICKKQVKTKEVVKLD